MNTKFHFH